MSEQKHESNEQADIENNDQPLKVRGSTTEGFHTYRDELPSSAAIAERKRQREEMASEIEAFLAKGGRVTEVERNVRADPPKKPESNYGSRPI